MTDEDRKLWSNRIKDYRSSGLTATKCAEDRGIAVYKLRYYINKFNKEKIQNSNQDSKRIKRASLVPKASVEEREEVIHADETSLRVIRW